MAVTNRVYAARKAKNLNQETLASLAGTTRNTIARIERGERNPSIEIALNLAKHLDLSVDELFVLQDD